MAKAEVEALRELGIGYANFYTRTFAVSTDAPEMDTFRAMSAVCDDLGLDFSIACYEADPADEVVRAAVQHNASPDRHATFRGVVFDELEHSRLLNYARPQALAAYKSFKSLDQAYRETVQGYERLRAKFEALGSPVIATHVFPVLLHAAARAGFTPCPKICKETYSTVSLATGLGAARQYGRALWADCDLWFYDLVPGHPPEEFQSNLLLAYWLGADVVYVEGSGFNLLPAGSQGIPFSLVNLCAPDRYQLTPHGEVLRWFCREYVPRHPRPWSARDLTPSIALVRTEDSECGAGRGGFTPGLFGTTNLLSTADTEAVFSAWNLLTFGKTGLHGLTYFNPQYGAYGYGHPPQDFITPSYLSRPLQSDVHRFYVPMGGVAVYDHLVGYDALKDVPLILVSGSQMSDETLAAVRRCAAEGAACVVWGPLARRTRLAAWSSGVLVAPEGKGRIIATDDFCLPEVVQQVWALLGWPDLIRYRFGQDEVILRRVDDNRVRVEVNGQPAGP
jgi:hypothetical protein